LEFLLGLISHTDKGLPNNPMNSLKMNMDNRVANLQAVQKLYNVLFAIIVETTRIFILFQNNAVVVPT